MSEQLPSAGDVEQLVRAQGAMFLVTDRNGDIAPAGARELGLFDYDTRFLSHYRLCIRNGQTVRLSAETTNDAFNQVDLMLSDQERADVLDDPKNFLHIRRRQMLDGKLAEQIVFTSFLTHEVQLDVSIEFGADFVDIFEVRGARRTQRGTPREPRVTKGDVLFSYDGLCGTRYSSRVAFTPTPAELGPRSARFALTLGAGETTAIEVVVEPQRDRADVRALGGTRGEHPFERVAERLEREGEAFRGRSTCFVCDDALLQGVLDQAIGDLHDLLLHVGDREILGAGIPWFCAPFGRDALITSYEALFVNPELAERSLRMLAAYRGTKYDEVTEEEPGKIFHELRFGEMARAKEIPHSPYYGTIDATPLFVIVADAYHRITGDRTLLRDIAPAITGALGWIDARSANGTRLVTYRKSTDKGLDNQGWKDSRAGVSFPDGQRAEPPIALCEVQGYCVDAYRRGARILAVLGEAALAEAYASRAEAMRALVDERMWLPEHGRYAFAIDGKGRALHTVVSNVGHLLWSRVPSPERAAATARLLLATPSFSGFGVRTLAAGQPVYNPLSYHNGTVWPHDNAIIARGFSNYDLAQEAGAVFDGMYAAMSFFADRRLPELFCGIARASGPLVRYPVACSPQAWAAAAPFLLLQSMLGLHAHVEHGQGERGQGEHGQHARLTVRNPRLPPSVRRVELHRLRVGGSYVSLRFRRVGKRCQVDRLDVAGAPLKTEIEID